MRLHLHVTSGAGGGLAVLRAVERVAPPGGLRRYGRLSRLLEALRGRPREDVIVILVAADAELTEVSAAAESLHDRRVVLLVHDASPSALLQGHRIRPRVLLAPPVDPEMVAGIVGRMVGAEAPRAAGAARRVGRERKECP